MKYLKQYRLFETVQNLLSELDTSVEDLQDIFQDLIDLFGRNWINYYSEKPNRWGVYHPYYTGRNLNDLFDIQDLDKSRSFESIELKFRKL